MRPDKTVYRTHQTSYKLGITGYITSIDHLRRERWPISEIFGIEVSKWTKLGSQSG